MFEHIILGFLQDGERRHGYDLITLYRKRSGSDVSTGNFYRELDRLRTQGLIQPGASDPDEDTRRIPYQITEAGRQEFERWLVGPVGQREELANRLLFADRIPPDKLPELLHRWQEKLLLRSKELAMRRDEVLASRHAGDATEGYDALACLLLRRMKHLSAEIEFINEFRLDFEEWLSRQHDCKDKHRKKHKKSESEESVENAKGLRRTRSP